MNQNIEVAEDRPIRKSIELLGGQWKPLIIFQLSRNQLKRSRLKKLIPDIESETLATELDELVKADLIHTKPLADDPSRNIYLLTNKGMMALPLIKEMRSFALKYENA